MSGGYERGRRDEGRRAFDSRRSTAGKHPVADRRQRAGFSPEDERARDLIDVAGFAAPERSETVQAHHRAPRTATPFPDQLHTTSLIGVCCLSLPWITWSLTPSGTGSQLPEHMGTKGVLVRLRGLLVV